MKIKTTGLTGSEWITRLEKKGYKVSSWASNILNSPTFKPSKKMELEYVIVRLTVESLSSDIGKKYFYTTQEIRDYAESKGYRTPPADLALILREEISDEDIEKLGLWWITVMHEPITDSDGDPRLLRVSRDVDGRWLGADYGRPGDGWVRGYGFVFLAPQGTKDSKLGTEALDSLPLELSEIIINGEKYVLTKKKK